MVTFLSLFLSLTLGTHEVRLGAEGRVAEIRLYLDGSLVGVDTRAPWVIPCDFGEALRPHELIAVAFDGSHRVIGRALQRVNLPREPAEASLSLIGDDGIYEAVEVTWQAADASAPEEISLFFDGEVLEVSESGQAELPDHSLRQIHIISAELVFPRQQRASTEIVFGGQYTEAVSTELTAVPLRARNGQPGEWSAEVLQQWLSVNGAPTRVVAVEEPRAEILMVREVASYRGLRHIARRAGRKARRVDARRPDQPQGQNTLSARNRRAFVSGMGNHDSLRFVDTRPILAEGEGGEKVKLFLSTPDLRHHTPGVGWAATNLFIDEEAGQLGEELATAVALAGIQAAASNRARAVVLVRAGVGVDGELVPATVRDFLRVLRVPLHYWRFEQDLSSDPWGEARLIPNVRAVNSAVKVLARDLQSQLVVWLEGSHMPQDIELTIEGAKRLELVGGGSSI